MGLGTVFHFNKMTLNNFVDCSFLCNLITMYECTLHMYDSHNDYAKNNDMLHAH